MEEQQSEDLRYPIGRFTVPDTYLPGLHNEWIAIIEALPAWLDVCIENLDAAQLDTTYRPDGWTINQVIHHLADSHLNAFIRLKLALTEEAPVIRPYEEKLWALTPEIEAVPVNVSITLLHALHRRWGTLLRHLQPADWALTYFHPEHNRHVPLWEMTAMYAWHSRHHMEHIRKLRERMGW